jgi:hypothetical protein
MSARAASRLLATALALLSAACGTEPLPPPHHALEAAALEDAPQGEAVPPPRGPTPGVWTAEVEFAVEDVSKPERPRRGTATIDLREVVTATDGTRRSEVTLHVRAPDGAAAEILGGLDGARVTVEHDAAGRPRLETLRLAEGTTPGAADFFQRLWLAGFGGSRPWLPAQAVRVGAAWPLPDERLEQALTALAARAGSGLPAPQRKGGARLERVEGADDDRRAVLRLELLTEIEGPTRDGGISVGNLVRGEATVSLATGQPLVWEVSERLRIRASGRGADEGDVIFTFRGRARHAGPAEGHDGG